MGVLGKIVTMDANRRIIDDGEKVGLPRSVGHTVHATDR